MTNLIDVFIYSPLLIKLAAVVIGIGSLLFRRERYRHRPAAGAEWSLPTTEVYIDPETRRRMRVYVNPQTGVRSYLAEEGVLPIYPPLERPGLLTPGPPHGLLTPGPPPGLGGPPPALPPPPS